LWGKKIAGIHTGPKRKKITGLLTGGISPLALINRGFQVWLDLSAKDFDEIHISGGQRGLNIRLPVNVLMTLTSARMGEISHPGSADND
jgi:Cys-tRNA(Pro)/Cys-tRNA(Cys) deacylase